MITGLSDLSSPSYWFTPNPGSISDQTAILFVVLFGFFVVMKILLRFMGRQYVVSLTRYHKAFLYRLENMFLTMGIVGLLWLFLVYEMIPFFSGRFWFIGWCLGVAIWAYYIVYYVRYELPALLSRDKERERARKYTHQKGRK